MKFQTCIAERAFTYVRAPSTVLRKQVLPWMAAISASGALIHHVYHNKLSFYLGQHNSG